MAYNTSTRPPAPLDDPKREWEIIVDRLRNQREAGLAEKKRMMLRSFDEVRRRGALFESPPDQMLSQFLHGEDEKLKEEEHYELQNRWLDMRSKYKSAGSGMGTWDFKF